EEPPQAGAPAEERSAAPEPREAADREAPHPSLSAPSTAAGAQAQAEAEETAHVRTPRERLRQAFSSELPENMMERRGAGAVMDVYPHHHAAATQAPTGQPVIRVVGVGGAGVNAVNRMVEAEVEGVEFLAINTDLQSLQLSAAHETLHIGDGITRGLGSGSDPELGRRAAREEYDRIKAMLRGADMVFIAAGS